MHGTHDTHDESVHSDLAGADDADGLAVNVEAKQALQGKVALPRAVVGPERKMKIIIIIIN